MTKEITKISVRAYAESLEISDKTVRNAIASGKIKKGVSYKTQIRNGKEVEVPEIVKEIADKEFGFAYQTGKIKPGQDAVKVIEKQAVKKEETEHKISADLPDYEDLDGLSDDELVSTLKVTKSTTYKDAIRLREVFAAQQDKLKLQELEGTLVKKSNVEKSLFYFGDQIKKDLLNIPARCIDNIMAAKNKVEGINILTAELEMVLNKLIDGNI